MIPRACLETELEHLLGRSLRGRLAFDFTANLQNPLERHWRTVLNLLIDMLYPVLDPRILLTRGTTRG